MVLPHGVTSLLKKNTTSVPCMQCYNFTPVTLHVDAPTPRFRQGKPHVEPQHGRSISQNHKITACSGLEGTSVGHLVQPSCRSRVTYSRLHRTLSRQGLNISREGDSTTSLGNLLQYSVTLRVKKFFLMFRRNFLSLSLCPLPLVLSLGTTEKSLAPSS